MNSNNIMYMLLGCLVVVVGVVHSLRPPVGVLHHLRPPSNCTFIKRFDFDVPEEIDGTIELQTYVNFDEDTRFLLMFIGYRDEMYEDVRDFVWDRYDKRIVGMVKCGYISIPNLQITHHLELEGWEGVTTQITQKTLTYKANHSFSQQVMENKNISRIIFVAHQMCDFTIKTDVLNY